MVRANTAARRPSSTGVLLLRPSDLSGADPETLVAAWLREVDADGRSAATLRGHGWHIRDTLRQLSESRGRAVSDLDLASVTHEELVDLIAAYRHASDRRNTTNIHAARQERSDYSLVRRVSSVRAFFAWAAERGHLPYDPSSSLTRPKIRGHLPRVLEVEDAARIYEAAKLSRWPARDLALAAVALGAGPRLNELAGMKVEDLLGRPPTHIRVLGKGQKERRVPLTASARDAVAEYRVERDARLEAWQLASESLWLPGRLRTDRAPGPARLSRVGIAKVFDRLLTDAGVRAPGLRAHVLRGTAATAILKSGRSVRDIQAVLGA